MDDHRSNIDALEYKNGAMIYNILLDHYNALYVVCHQYFNLPRFVHKKCSNGAGDWLIILEKTLNTKTNQFRQFTNDNINIIYKNNISNLTISI